MALTESQIKELTLKINNLKSAKRRNLEDWDLTINTHKIKDAMYSEFIEMLEKLVEDWKTDK